MQQDPLSQNVMPEPPKKTKAVFIIVVASVIVLAVFLIYIISNNREDEGEGGFVNTLSDIFTGLYVDEHSPSEGEKISDLIKSGKNEQAADSIKSILDNPENYSLRDVSTAKFHSPTVYAQTGDDKDAIAAIQSLKENFLDGALSLQTRVDNLYLLATVYCSYARDDATIREVFKGEPFSQHWVEGEPRQSTQNLIEWSYDLLPTSKIAITLSHREAGNLITNSDLSSPEKQGHIDNAKLYLKEAEDLMVEEINAPDSTFLGTRGYIHNMYWRAMTIMILDEIANEDDFAGRGLIAYEEFFAAMDFQNNVASQHFTPFADVMLAFFSQLRGDDDEVADAHLKKAIEFVENDTVHKVNRLVEFIRDSEKNGDTVGGPVLFAIRSMESFSPTFAEFVENAIAEE